MLARFQGVSALSSGGVHRLRIAASYTVGEYLAPKWIEAFQRRAPQVVTELLVSNSEAVVREFRSGGANLCFIESGRSAPDLDRQPVARDSLVVVVSSEHPWAARDSIAAAELAEETWVARESGSGTRAVAERAFHSAGLKAPLPAMELASTGAIKQALRAGHSYALLSSYVVREELTSGLLSSPAVEGLRLERSLGLVQLARRPPASSRPGARPVHSLRSRPNPLNQGQPTGSRPADRASLRIGATYDFDSS